LAKNPITLIDPADRGSECKRLFASPSCPTAGFVSLLRTCGLAQEPGPEGQPLDQTRRKIRLGKGLQGKAAHDRAASLFRRGMLATFSLVWLG